MVLGRVLIVDDQEAVRQTVRRTLIKAGYETLEAADGAQAIQLLETDHNADSIDTIICDLQMPNIDGSEAIQYFKRRYPLIPIVILTGAPDFVLTEVLGQEAVADYLLKPVSGKRLLEVVRVTVRLHGLRRNQT